MRQHRALWKPAIVLCALLASPVPAAGQDMESEAVRIVGTFPAQHSSTRALERAAAELADTTMGRLEVEVEPGLTGGAEAAIERLRTGDAAFAYVDLATLEPLVPAFGVITLPFLFQDRERAFELLDRPGFGRLLDLALRVHGLAALAYFDGGARHLASTAGPIETLDGKRIALGRGNMHAEAFRAAGAEPVTEGGNADLREQALAKILAGGGDTQGLHVSPEPHAYDVIVVLADTERYDDLLIDYQELIQAALERAETWQHGVAAQEHATAMDALRERGAQLAPLPEDLRTSAGDAVVAMLEQMVESDQEPIVDAVLAYAR